MKADMILRSNAVFTGLENEPFKGIVAVTGNSISYVGRKDPDAGWIDENTKIYDLGDRMVMPGFSDAHAHYLLSASILSRYCCTELTVSKSEEESVEMMKAFYKKNPDAERLTGFGWFPVNWTEGDRPHQLPTKKSLDREFPDIPVYLLAADCHTFWCNSKALEQCSIHSDMEYSFGYLGIGEDGEPDGILTESELIAPCYDKFFDFPERESEEMQENMLNLIAQAGITSFTDVAECTKISGVPIDLIKIKEMEEKGKLTARMHVYPCLGTDTDLSLQKRIRDEYSSPMVKIAGLKQFFDGVTSTYTAALLSPYDDDHETSGQLNYSRELYDRCITAANREGFGVKIHCIGDAAVRTGLDIFEHSSLVNWNYSACRNSIEHIESISPEDIPRFGRLGVTASVQPVHLPLDANEKISRIGRERCRWEWPFRSILDMGGILAFGTDSPVSGLDPYANLHAAVTRKDPDNVPTGCNPEEKITLCEALRAYTYGSAYSHNREDELGTLEVGKLADITVVDRNLFDQDPDDIKNAATSMTIVDGRVVYSSL